MSSDAIAQFAVDMHGAAGDAAWSDTFRRGFGRLRRELQLHPAGSPASVAFEAAARTARSVAAECLPLGVALVMHLYPLCVLRCVPLPWWSTASRRRARLLRAIDRDGWVLANAGSERSAGAHAPVMLTRTPDGIRIDGTYDYVSLAHVADVVLFCAPLAGGATSLFCAADLRSESVRIGANRFDGSMRLADTCPVTFVNQRLPADRCIEIPTATALQCMARYQRSWFELLLGEAYLARIERLRDRCRLPESMDRRASVNELAQLREYALRLLDDAASSRSLQSLSRVSATMKLRISWLAQATAGAVRNLDEAAARELEFLRRQPTSDDRILAALAATGPSGSPAPAPAPAARTRSASRGYTTPLASPRAALHR